MKNWFLLVVVQDGLRGECCVTTDIDEAVRIAFEHRGECSVVVISIETSRAEKRPIHRDADQDEIRNRVLNGIQLSENSAIGSRQLC